LAYCLIVSLLIFVFAVVAISTVRSTSISRHAIADCYRSVSILDRLQRSVTSDRGRNC